MREPDFTPDDLCVRFQVSKATLRRWRREGIGPPYRKLTDQLVRYPADSTRDWEEGAVRTSTKSS